MASNLIPMFVGEVASKGSTQGIPGSYREAASFCDRRNERKSATYSGPRRAGKPVASSSIRRRGLQRQADPPADDGRQQPQQQHGAQKNHSVAGVCHSAHAKYRPSTIATPARSTSTGNNRTAYGGVATCIGGQLPEQQTASGKQHPYTRAQDRIQANQRVVRQKDQRQQTEHDGTANRLYWSGQVTSQSRSKVCR